MSDFKIINGFDRCGSSAISRILSSHKDIELIMQPFNSGFIRKKLYQIFNEKNENSEAFQFFNGLSKNKIKEEFIHSQWYYEFSSTRKYIPNKIHLIKTTINHFAQKWMKDNFPDIDVWGIWREPEDIVESIIRNGFYGKWYPEGVKEVTPTIRNEPELKKHYENLLGQVNNEIRNTAFLLAARTHFFLKYLDKDKLIIYEKFKKDPNHLLKFTRYYGLSDSDFSDMAAKDLNITGKMTKTKQADMFEQADKEFMDKIFEPIKKLKKTRFDD